MPISLSSAALLLAVAAPPAPADRIAITVEVQRGTEGVPGISPFAAFDAAGRAVSFVAELEAVPKEAMFGTSAGDLGYQLSACRAELGCLAARLRQADVGRSLELVLNLSLEPAILSARLIDADATTEMASTLVEFDVTGTALPKLISQTVTGLLDEAGHTIQGRLVVETTPSGAEVRVDPPARRSLTGGFVVTPGTYAVEAGHPGYHTASVQVTVERGAEQAVTLRLEAEEGSIVASPWFWAIVGVAAAGAATGAYFAFRPADAGFSLCQASERARCGL